MTEHSIKSRFLARHDATEGDVRGVFGRRRRTPSTADAERVNTGAKSHDTAGGTSVSAGAGPLRRWSVAELIARAAGATAQRA